MPTKQIYVKEADLPIYAKAEKYGTSLANVVVEALREYVKRQEELMDAEGFCQIDLEIGRYLPQPIKTSIKRFRGKHIASYVVNHHEGTTEDCFDMTCSIYFTRKAKYIIWCRQLDYECVEVGEENDTSLFLIAEQADLRIVDELPKVPPDENFFTVEEMLIPSELIQIARNKMSQTEDQEKDENAGVEELDV